jgi:hypothetical protein
MIQSNDYNVLISSSPVDKYADITVWYDELDVDDIIDIDIETPENPERYGF